MTTTKAQATGTLGIGETLAYATRSFVIRLQRTVEAYAVTVEQGGFRIDELARTRDTESAARDLARRIATMLRDGATVAEVVAAIQPAADLISATTAYLALAAEARKLSDAQQAAVLAADADGWIARRDVGTVKTLYALRDLHLGDLVRRGYTPLGLTLNGRGREIRQYLVETRKPIAA